MLFKSNQACWFFVYDFFCDLENRQEKILKVFEKKNGLKTRLKLQVSTNKISVMLLCKCIYACILHAFPCATEVYSSLTLELHCQVRIWRSHSLSLILGSLGTILWLLNQVAKVKYTINSLLVGLRWYTPPHKSFPHILD